MSMVRGAVASACRARLLDALRFLKVRGTAVRQDRGQYGGTNGGTVWRYIIEVHTSV